MQDKILKFLKKHLGNYRNTKKGSHQYAFQCPNPSCPHKKKKFEINIDVPDKPLMHCWVCNYKSREYLHFFYRFFSKEVYFAFRKECFNDGQSLLSFEERLSLLLREEKQNSLVPNIELPFNYQYLGERGVDNLDTLNARYYLTKRGIRDKDIKNFYLGFCQEGDYKNRIIFPSFDGEGNLNFFIGRTAGKTLPKYLCSTEKSSIIYNELNLDFTKPLLIAEGTFDVIKASEVFPNCTCLLGKQISLQSKLFKKILQYKTPIYLALDNNAKRDAFESIKLLVKHDIAVFNISLEEHKDFGEMCYNDIHICIKNAEEYSIENYLSFVKKVISD